MTSIATGLVTIVTLLHVDFLVQEDVSLATPFGMNTFGTTPEVAASSAVLAGNQGLFSGFLAAGLLRALASYGIVQGRAIPTFFLGYVIVAALYAATARALILCAQAMPAALALAVVWGARSGERR